VAISKAMAERTSEVHPMSKLGLQSWHALILAGSRCGGFAENLFYRPNAARISQRLELVASI